MAATLRFELDRSIRKEVALPDLLEIPPRVSTMKFVGLLLVALGWVGGCSKVTTLVIVRHADREPGDVLSSAGLARAGELVHVAEKANINAIYHSDTVRTRQTAEPLATALGIVPVEYPANEVNALVRRIFREQRGRTVLIVGHSNTVPRIIAATGGPHLPDLADKEFDGLYVVNVSHGFSRKSNLTELQYGAISP